MTREKRELSEDSDPSLPPHKAVKTGENGNENESPGQASSSQQISTQPFLSRLGSSQQESSLMSDKSLSDISESEKAGWREYFGPNEFFEFTEWGQEFQAAFISCFNSRDVRKGYSFQEWLVLTAQDDLLKIYLFIQMMGLSRQIDWTKIPYNDTLSTKMNTSIDNLIYVWIRLKRFDYFLRTTKGVENEYLQMLVTMMPTTRREERKFRELERAQAFHREQKTTENGKLPSEAVYRKIVEYYGRYHDRTHLSPYTSIVGPSGIGKSFSIQQLAMVHGMYVVYTSFAGQNSPAYPSRSVVADKLPQNSERRTIIDFWNCFTTITLSHAEICKKIGITPTGFFNLQTKSAYKDYQHQVSQQIQDFAYVRQNRKTYRQRTYLGENTNISRDILLEWHSVLVDNNDNSSSAQQSDTIDDIPKALIAIDEASELIRDEDAISFRSLREALRNRFQKRCSNQVDFLKPQGDFFCVLLDTTSKVGNFSPSAHFDKSQRTASRMGVGRRLFPPIYNIDTMDIFRANRGQIIQDGTSEAVSRLFRLGRPLWGSRYETKAEMSIEDLNEELRDLACEKTGCDDPTFDLALFSYRINFYIGSDALASELVSKCLRYIIYINETRDFLRTIQPSEPILAFVSSLEMKDLSKRLRIISQFITSCFEGTVNIGDVGEVTAALALLFSSDNAHALHTSNYFPTAIPLARFTESLFGQHAQTFMSEVLQSDTEMKELWQNGRVFFNHMVKLEKVPNEQTLELGFERGAAFFLPDGFRGADILVPIQVSGTDMTYLLIQVKNRKDDKVTASLRNKAASSLTEATKALKMGKNYIGVMMCLRCQTSEAGRGYVGGENENNHFQIVLPRVQTRRSRGQETSTMYWPTTEKRLVALVMGFDAQTYPSIDKYRGKRTEESAQIVSLLQRLLSCIPRTSMPDSTEDEYVRRVKTLAV